MSRGVLRRETSHYTPQLNVILTPTQCHVKTYLKNRKQPYQEALVAKIRLNVYVCVFFLVSRQQGKLGQTDDTDDCEPLAPKINFHPAHRLC